MVMHANRQAIICENLNVKDIDGEMVILNRSTEQIHTLNSTASFIWNLIEQQSDRESIIQRLTESYDISPGNAAADLDLILDQLVELDLIKMAA